MKKTLTVNLGGTVFQIDEDAYILLDNYLNNLRFHFRKEKEGEEIVSDMEMRISELFGEFMEGGQQVITIDNVEAVIARMGKPEDIDGDDEGSSSDGYESKAENNQYASGGGRNGEGGNQYGAKENAWNTSDSGNRKVVKRLFRDVDNRVLGGVLAGIAAYCGWDRTVFRLLIIILGLLPYFGLGFPMLILYFILQFVIPPARTATEKLQMRGEPVNMENIGKTVTDGFEKEKNAGEGHAKRTGFYRLLEVIVMIFAILVKIFIGFLLLCCIPVLFGLLVAFFAIIMSALGIIIHIPNFCCDWMSFLPWHSIACSTFFGPFFLVCALLVVGIPVVGIIHFVFQRIDHRAPMTSSVKITLLAIWLLALIAGGFSLVLV